MLYSVHADRHDCLAMPLRLLVALSSSLLEYDSLRALRLLLDSRVDASVLDLRSPYRSIVDGADHENVIEADLSAHFERELLDAQDVIV